MGRPPPQPASSLTDGRAAAARGAWTEAYEQLLAADATAPLTGADLPLLAGVAYAAGHLDVTIDAWERAYASSLRAGDAMGAAGAAVRVALHLLFDTALMAPVRGWLARAERLLEGARTPVHAWLAVVRSYERLLSGDFVEARRWAGRAVEAGAGREPAAAAIGRLAEARCRILQGEVAEGLALLNEAAVATVSGEIDPLSTGVVYCEVVCAAQALGQYDLAQQWTDAMERWHPGHPVGSVHGRCRVHRAEMLRLRGACAEAEQEALRACEELRPYLRRELGWPLTELGLIRLRLGDVAGAEAAFVAAHRAGWDPQPGLALVQLAQGHIADAAASIHDALERPSVVPSKEWPPNTPLRRAPLLEAQVEIALAAGDVAGARAAAGELADIATQFQSSGLTAGATLARGRIRLAEEAWDDARREFDAAAGQWSEIGAPYETALARLGCGAALRAQGQHTRAAVELRAAQATFERIGAHLLAARAAAMLEASTPAAKNAALRLRAEGDQWALSFDGHLVRLRDAKGLRYLSQLVAHPGREFHVLDLVAAERPAAGRDAAALADAGDGGDLLDARATAAYRRRLIEIDADLAEAQAAGDESRAAQAEAERDILVRELSRAVGLGGRRRRAGSASERARSAVTRAIRLALARVQSRHGQLGEHLARTVRTGTYCVYLPDARPMPRIGYAHRR